MALRRHHGCGGGVGGVGCGGGADLAGASGSAIRVLGWAVTRDKELREQLVLGKFATVLSCSAIDEALALRVLQQSERIIGERRKHLAAGFAKTAAWVYSVFKGHLN